MHPELWQTAVAILAILGAIRLEGYFRIRAQNRRDDAESDEHTAVAEERRESSAKLLAEAYGKLVDDLREDIIDARVHVKRQDDELAEVRKELRAVREQRDLEVAALRLELAEERAESGRLRARVATLEAMAHGQRVEPPATA